MTTVRHWPVTLEMSKRLAELQFKPRPRVDLSPIRSRVQSLYKPEDSRVQPDDPNKEPA